MFQIEEVSGIGEYKAEDVIEDSRKTGEIFQTPDEKVFLVLHFATDGGVKTVEVRTDGNLAKTLKEEYESVMDSRYFGRGGIEVVMTGQLSLNEVYDLVRLSYNMSCGE